MITHIRAVRETHAPLVTDSSESARLSGCPAAASRHRTALEARTRTVSKERAAVVSERVDVLNATLESRCPCRVFRDARRPSSSEFDHFSDATRRARSVPVRRVAR